MWNGGIVCSNLRMVSGPRAGADVPFGSFPGYRLDAAQYCRSPEAGAAKVATKQRRNEA
jgi:hypothetical protein